MLIPYPDCVYIPRIVAREGKVRGYAGYARCGDGCEVVGWEGGFDRIRECEFGE